MSVPRRTRDVHPNLLLAIFAVAAYMTALDVFIVNVGLPALGRDVGQGSLNDLRRSEGPRWSRPASG